MKYTANTVSICPVLADGSIGAICSSDTGAGTFNTPNDVFIIQ